MQNEANKILYIFIKYKNIVYLKNSLLSLGSLSFRFHTEMFEMLFMNVKKTIFEMKLY